MNRSNINILKGAIFGENFVGNETEIDLEKKSMELFDANQKLLAANTRLESLVKDKTSELKRVFENISDAFLVMDVYGDVLKMNDAAIKLFGYDSKKEKFNVLKLLFIEDMDYAFGSFDELMRNGEFRNFVCKIKTKTNEVKWIQINASLVYDEKSMPVAAQGIIRDITKSKKVSEIIKEQRAQLEIIVENSSFGIVLTDKCKIIKSNRVFQDLFGYNKEELDQLHIKEISYDLDFPKYEFFLEHINQEKNDNYSVENRYLRKDGSYLWARSRINAVRSSDGSIKYEVVIVEDITKEREKALTIKVINEVAKSILGKMDTHEIAWEIVNSITNYLGSADCVIYIVNEATNSLNQVAAYGNKAIGKTIVDEITIPIGKGIVGTVALTGKPELIKDTSKDPRYIIDDDIRLSEITVPIFYDGRIIGVIDSEHKDENFYTQNHLDTLTNIARLVSMQLNNSINLSHRLKAEDKNKHLVKELEKSNKELQEYAHIVSHDLKSPLRSIEALVNWIKEDNKDKFDQGTLTNFNHIENTLGKMELLISDILIYSSINTSNSDQQTIDLNKVVHDIQEILFIPTHISVNILTKLPIIRGDKIKMQQLFQNLLSNAVKFCDKEQGIIDIDVKERKSFYEFSIKDNGIGINKMFHDRIFKIFHSLENNNNSTGVGLSIVKGILELYNGEIWIESEPGRGSIFYFTLKKDFHGTA